jgi:hypothetical protein
MPNGKVYIQKRNFGVLQAPDNFWLIYEQPPNFMKKPAKRSFKQSNYKSRFGFKQGKKHL